jgi:hypothetical protein
MRLALLASALVLVAGCQETVHCAQGMYGRNCDQYLSGFDGGVDSGEDAGTDAFEPVDAGPCPSCGAGLQCLVSDAGMGMCVDCVEDVDCIARLGDGGMPDGGVPIGRPVCTTDHTCAFGCVDAVDCDGNECRPDGTCSAYEEGRMICMACDTDRNCATGLRCVQFRNGGHDGAYCLANASDVACDERRRFTSVLSDQPSVDGPPPDDYCVPSATCEAVLDANGPCATSTTCGVVDGSNTGACVSATYCTYTCTMDNDCPAGLTCDGASSTCRR